MSLEAIMPDAILQFLFLLRCSNWSRHLRMSFCILALIATMPNGSRNNLYCLNDHRRVLSLFVLQRRMYNIRQENSGEIDLQCYQVVSRVIHEEHRYPHSESPTLEANRIAICYYLLDEGRVLYLTILYKYYNLIYKIRLHLLHLRLDSDAGYFLSVHCPVTEAPPSDVLL